MVATGGQDVGLDDNPNWEKLRFAILTAGDFLLGSGMKKVVNGEHLDIFSIVALTLKSIIF
jgi:hypothetical protein